MTDAESSVDKVDTYMHPYSISLGQKVSKRTKVIANSRPDIEFMYGFTSGPMELRQFSKFKYLMIVF